MFRIPTAVAALCLAPALAFAQMASAPFDGRLKKIHDTKTINVAYRTDAVPFSFEDNDKKPTGYMVELFRSVIGVIGAGAEEVRFTGGLAVSLASTFPISRACRSGDRREIRSDSFGLLPSQ